MSVPSPSSKASSIAFLLASSLVALLAAQQPTTIRVPVHLVTAPTLVLSKQGRVIDGLAQSDFHLQDNHRPQNINLESGALPLSVALAVQINNDVREYLPFIARVGSVVDTMLVAQTGDAAVLTYSDEVTVSKSFGTGDVAPVLKSLAPTGQPARMIDAGVKAISLLKQQPGARSRVLLLIGQSSDRGSYAQLSTLQQQAEGENVSICALTLPELGKSFISDSFHVNGLGSQGSKGGYQASVELTKLIPVLKRSARAVTARDPFSVLTAATGGIQLHFHTQAQLEDSLALMGQELRSLYTLTYAPDLTTPGYHTIKVQVDVPGARVFSRPGYHLGAD